jgi:DNA-directed RNA polymerase subunit RPC12/RpoP
MFELKTYKCPTCNWEIREDLKGGQEIKCSFCKSAFLILLDEASGKIGFLQVGQELTEPLFLPPGSIRAISAIALSISCWVLIVRDSLVPDYLLGLILTIVGYYFGFRKKLKAAQSKIYDATAEEKEPLRLPAGVIRYFIIIGFAVGAMVLYVRGKLLQGDYLEFYVVLAGLILGYIYAKLTSLLLGYKSLNLLNHLKGVLVLVCVAWLSILFLGGVYEDSTRTALFLSCVVSFYFGSRS